MTTQTAAQQTTTTTTTSWELRDTGGGGGGGGGGGEVRSVYVCVRKGVKVRGGAEGGKEGREGVGGRRGRRGVCERSRGVSDRKHRCKSSQGRAPADHEGAAGL